MLRNLINMAILSILGPSCAVAGPILIGSTFENRTDYVRTITGGITTFNDSHVAMDNPNTPWFVSTRIEEDAGFSNDSISIRTTMRHLLGPMDHDDINPNPEGNRLLDINFTAPSQAGTTTLTDIAIIDHRTMASGLHFNGFMINLTATVTQGESITGTRWQISRWELTERAIHRGTLAEIERAFIPEPSTIALSGLGTFGLLCYARWRRGPAKARADLGTAI